MLSMSKHVNDFFNSLTRLDPNAGFVARPHRPDQALFRQQVWD